MIIPFDKTYRRRRHSPTSLGVPETMCRKITIIYACPVCFTTNRGVNFVLCPMGGAAAPVCELWAHPWPRVQFTDSLRWRLECTWA